MTRSLRVLALWLGLVLLLLSASACGERDGSVPTSTEPVAPVVTSGESEPSEETSPYRFEVVYPSVSVSSMKFDLTDQALDDYKAKLKEVKAQFSANKAGGEDAFRHALYELLSIEAGMETQRDIAYLLYCANTADSKAWDRYLYAFELHDEANDLFWAFYNTASEKKTPLAAVFRDVVETEYKGNLITSTPDANTYRRQMEVLEGEYNALQASGASDERMFEVYKQYLMAAHGLATSSGALNYYLYAQQYVTFRTDTLSQRRALRAYTKDYLIPLYQALRERSRQIDQTLSSADYTASSQYLYASYDSFKEDYHLAYFSSLPTSLDETMTGAFEKDRVLVASKPQAYNSAMVYVVGDTPICYFHKSQTTLETVAHEVGHYCASILSDTTYASLDLRETHSTANTMLLYSYLSSELNSRAFTSAEVYQASNWVYQIISSVIKDEFDEKIFKRDPSSLTLDRMETIMQDLIEDYGVTEWSSSLAEQLTTYWRRLGIVYPITNYCYATAMVSSLQLYLESKEDYTAACERYKILVETKDVSDYLSILTKAGLTSPYDEQTYRTLDRLKTLFA